LAGRLIERDTALETLERFLSSLPHRGRGVLAISGPTGSGHTRMLTDAVDAARLRNYATLTIAARPALRTRPFGALRAAKGLLFDIELAQQGAAPLMAALRTELAGAGRAGLLIAVDGLLDLDRATLELLVAVLDLADRDRPIAALICTLGPYDPSRVRGFDPSIITTLNLAPLSLQGTRLWLREALRCELPEAFVRWLYQEVAGLPAMLERATGFLIADRRIIPDSSGWLPHRCRPPPSWMVSSPMEWFSSRWRRSPQVWIWRMQLSRPWACCPRGVKARRRCSSSHSKRASYCWSSTTSSTCATASACWDCYAPEHLG